MQPFSLPPLKVPAQIMARGKSEEEEEEECLEIFHNSPPDRPRERPPDRATAIALALLQKFFGLVVRPPYLLASSREQYQISSAFLPSFPPSLLPCLRSSCVACDGWMRASPFAPQTTNQPLQSLPRRHTPPAYRIRTIIFADENPSLWYSC